MENTCKVDTIISLRKEIKELKENLNKKAEDLEILNDIIKGYAKLVEQLNAKIEAYQDCINRLK